MKKSRWQCASTIRLFHLVSEKEMNERLAQTWEVLLGLKGQQNFRQDNALYTDTVLNLSQHGQGEIV